MEGCHHHLLFVAALDAIQFNSIRIVNSYRDHPNEWLIDRPSRNPYASLLAPPLAAAGCCLLLYVNWVQWRSVCRYARPKIIIIKGYKNCSLFASPLTTDEDVDDEAGNRLIDYVIRAMTAVDAGGRRSRPLIDLWPLQMVNSSNINSHFEWVSEWVSEWLFEIRFDEKWLTYSLHSCPHAYRSGMT